MVSMVLISVSPSLSAQRPKTVSGFVGRGWMNLESTGWSALCHRVSQLILNLQNICIKYLFVLHNSHLLEVFLVDM